MSQPRQRCTGPENGPLRELPLPILNQEGGAEGKVRASRNGPRRAWVLAILNLLMAVHVIQWWWTGRTVSPIEPSETVYTLTQGFINAGFIFLLLAMLATTLFGRFVCGWGCHVVALQDLCAWIMKKCGVRPKPFRSRLLMWVPLLAGLYMFVWPIAYRAWQWAAHDHPLLPRFTNQLVTSDFWKTFPSVAIAIPFLLICGFATVYFLGAKGFCTYACPYGGMFALADQFARGRIRVTDACEHCGHCTAVCTSNVLVHAEVRDYGMVVDPGCMKCMDCVSVCPNEALYFGFGKPSVVAKPRVEVPAERGFGLTWKEELVVALVFVWAFVAYRGIYGVVPFLLALAIAGILAFIVHKLLRIFQSATVKIQNLVLKQDQQVTPAGWVAALLTSAVLVLTLHSSVIQYHSFRGHLAFTRTPSEESVLSGDIHRIGFSESQAQAVEKGLNHFGFCDRWGLLPDPETKLRLAWFHLLKQDGSRAESKLREVISLSPSEALPHYYLARLLTGMNRAIEAVVEFNAALLLSPENIEIRFHRGIALAALNRIDEAMADWQNVSAADPTRASALHNLAGAYRQRGRFADAIECYERVLKITPDDAGTHFFLAVTLTQAGRSPDGLTHFQRAVELDPKNAEYHYQLGLSLLEANPPTEATIHLQEAARLDPKYRPPS